MVGVIMKINQMFGMKIGKSSIVPGEFYLYRNSLCLLKDGTFALGNKESILYFSSAEDAKKHIDKLIEIYSKCKVGTKGNKFVISNFAGWFLKEDETFDGSKVPLIFPTELDAICYLEALRNGIKLDEQEGDFHYIDVDGLIRIGYNKNGWLCSKSHPSDPKEKRNGSKYFKSLNALIEYIHNLEQNTAAKPEVKPTMSNNRLVVETSSSKPGYFYLFNHELGYCFLQNNILAPGNPSTIHYFSSKELALQCLNEEYKRFANCKVYFTAKNEYVIADRYGNFLKVDGTFDYHEDKLDFVTFQTKEQAKEYLECFQNSKPEETDTTQPVATVPKKETTNLKGEKIFIPNSMLGEFIVNCSNEVRDMLDDFQAGIPAIIRKFKRRTLTVSLNKLFGWWA
jgi:hypothetical protein